MIFKGTNSGSGVILTVLLRALGRLSDMVIIAISLVEVAKVAGVTGLEVSTVFREISGEKTLLLLVILLVPAMLSMSVGS